MNKSKFRFLKALLLVFICFISFGCNQINNKENQLPEGETEFTIYTINDFHGMLLETSSSTGISKIGNYLIEQKNKNPDTTLIISAGDMFQGTAVSSMSRGRAVVDVMNYIGFDAMTVGNHEFDWGDDVVKAYCDGNEDNGELTFPYLGANIIDKRTNQIASWVEPYTVVEKAGFKIGIIGVIGDDQESDILQTYVQNYDFTREIDAISKYAEVLRTEEDCDIVIVSAHNDTSSYNKSLAKLNGDRRIDAVINGHTHQYYDEEIDTYRNGYANLPIIQTGCYGSYIGKITITIDNKTKMTTDSSAKNLRTSAYCKTSNDDIDNILSNYQEYIDLSNSKLGVSGVNLYQEEGGVWASNVLRDTTNSDLGVCNKGGIRGNGFPIYSRSDITYGDIFEIMPFENAICTVNLKGSDVIRLLGYGVFISDNVDAVNETINGVSIDSNKIYKVATIDFIYVKSSYPFVNGTDGKFTDMLFRDALVNDVIENVKQNGTFIPFN